MFHKRSTKALLVAAVLSALFLTACGGTQPSGDTTDTPGTTATTPTAAPADNNSSAGNAETVVPTTAPTLVVQLNGLASELSSFDQKTEQSAGDVEVSLNNTTATISGSGCALVNSVLNITAPGTYILSGTLNGQVAVSVDKTEKVRLILNNATITCADGPAIIITSADKVAITLADGTTNTLTDGTTYSNTDDKAPNACVYSKDDLTINGNGTLNVNANFHNGVDTSNDLKIVSGTINITAKNHAIKGNDSVSVFGGTITVKGGNDGIKSDTEGEAGKGFFYMNGGTLDITAVDDGIQATTSIRIDSGSVSFHVQDDATNSDGSTAIAEGVVK